MIPTCLTVSRTKTTGFSLVEALICSAIMMMLMGAILAALVASRERGERNSALILMEEEALNALSLMVSDLAETHVRSVWTPDEHLLVFPLPRDLGWNFLVEPDGSLRWSVLLAYRGVDRDGTPYLLRQMVDVADSVQDPIFPEDLSPLPDQAFLNGSTTNRKLMARGFQSLQVAREDDLIRLRLEVETSHKERRFGLVLSSAVMPRN